MKSSKNQLKNRLWKRNKWTFLLLSVFFSLFFLGNCVQFRESSGEIIKNLPSARVATFEEDGRNIRFMQQVRNVTFPTLLFLHGSPSSMSVYNAYYEDPALADWANILSVDRPGYGYSDFGKSEISVERQAKIIWRAWEEAGSPQPLYIIGSSYGGTVAAKMAMQKPEVVDGLLLVSASLMPGAEKIYRISYLIRHAPFKWIVPRMLRVANDEKLSHEEQLNNMLPFWERIISPVIFVYGLDDDLIYPENAQFAIERLTNSPYIEDHPLEGEGHFLQLKYKDFILQRIKNLIDNQSDSVLNKNRNSKIPQAIN